MSYLTVAQAIQDSDFGVALREAPIAFPIVEGLHLIGLAVSFGLIVFVDLRLLGWVLRDVPIARIVQPLRRWLFAGFAATFATGALLFWADAGELVQNVPFLTKSVLVLLALANAVVFDLEFSRRAAAPHRAPLSDARLRWAGGLSLGLWTLVTISGRLIPYYASH